MNPERFKIAKNDVIKVFDSQNKNIFTYSEISDMLTKNRDFWRFTADFSAKKFIDTLETVNLLNETSFQFPSFKKNLYIWKSTSDYSILLSIRPDSYFSHYSAMYLHNLTEQIPKVYYLNTEQSPKLRIRNNAILTQDKVDMAFSRPQRLTNNISKFNDSKVCLLNGKNHNKLGVTSIKIDDQDIPVTDIDRTLIDITVRPEYSGGIRQVFQAFKAAKGRTSINKIQAYLKKMDYVYPYHQALGFYLSRSGNYTDEQLSILKQKPFEIEFYLGHKLSNLKLDPYWRIYYPAEIDSEIS